MQKAAVAESDHHRARQGQTRQSRAGPSQAKSHDTKTKHETVKKAMLKALLRLAEGAEGQTDGRRRKKVIVIGNSNICRGLPLALPLPVSVSVSLGLLS